MKRILVLLAILLLSPGIEAWALSSTPTPPPLPTATPTPTPAPEAAYRPISGAVQARVYYEGE